MEFKFHRLEFFQRLTSSVSLLLGGVDTSIAWFQSSLLPLPTPLFSVERFPRYQGIEKLFQSVQIVGSILVIYHFFLIY